MEHLTLINGGFALGGVLFGFLLANKRQISKLLKRTENIEMIMNESIENIPNLINENEHERAKFSNLKDEFDDGRKQLKMKELILDKNLRQVEKNEKKNTKAFEQEEKKDNNSNNGAKYV